jgi:hypothetical protein
MHETASVPELKISRGRVSVIFDSLLSYFTMLVNW